MPAANIAQRVPVELRRKLGPRRWRFVLCWARTGFEQGKASEAARQAGYTDKSAPFRARELKRHPLVNEAIRAVAEYLESTDIIDEKWVINGLAREAAEAPEPRDRIVALGTLAKIRQLGSFGGPKQAAPGNVVQQILVLAQSQGIDKDTGQVRDASRFAAQLARAFGREQAAGMLASLGMDAGALLGVAELGHDGADIRPDADVIDVESHLEHGDDGASA